VSESVAHPQSQPTPSESGACSTEGMGDVRDLLLRINCEMAGAESLEQVLQTMANAALRVVPTAEKCVIHLLDADGSTLQARVCSPPALVAAEASDIPAHTGIAGRALGERSIVCVDDVTCSPEPMPLYAGLAVRSLLVAPLYVADVSLGTLSLSSDRPTAFGPAECQNIAPLAAQAALAIRQANLISAAQQERAYSNAIIESMADGLVILSRESEGRILRINSALCRMLEIAPGEFKLPCTLDDPACPAQLRTLLVNAASTHEGPCEYEVSLPSGDRVALRVLPPPPHTDAAGEVRVVLDITMERRTAEARALFIAQVAHELRTPLQHIMGFVGLISDIDDLPRENYTRFFGRIQSEVEHLARLVDDLGEFARMNTGRFTVQMQRTSVDDLIFDTMESLAPRIHLAGITLQLERPEQVVWAYTDAGRLKQVLTNLIENALKFVPAGGRVSVALETTPSDAIVSVADDGPGIPGHALAHIFDQFYRVVSDTPHKNPGMGLGLYISREIIHALGGEIWVESDFGVGTTFFFRVPLGNP
jgi:signal transduction histidine kinase